ncbi:MAG: Ppx/GppA family phosphatase [Sphingomonadales bacterium]
MSEADKTNGAIANGGSRRVGVIDVGSNSVRLVVYQSGKRVPILVFNEKVLCGLGRKLSSTGLLDPEGVELALASTRRFTVLAREMGVDRLDMVATAAVRDAGDGADFVARVSDFCGHELKILSGHEEAHLAACGIMAGFAGADGLVGDLGGGSLELVGVGQGNIGAHATLPLGPLQLLDLSRGDPDIATRVVDEHLCKQAWIGDFHGHTFYAIGGAWRALAKLHMARTGYKLRILHYYTAGGKDMLAFARFIAGQTKDSLRRFQRAPKKRLATLPFAARALAGVLDVLQPRRVVFSALGLREGLLFNQLTPEVRKLDPLIEECRARASEQGRFAEHGHELFDWIGPLFATETARKKRLRLATCLLSDTGWRGHPDYRAELILGQIMNGQFVSLDHPGRAFVGLALFICYGGSLNSNSVQRVTALLNREQIVIAQRIGVALRLGQRISGGTEGLLHKCGLVASDRELALKVPHGRGHLVGEVAARRLKALGQTLGLTTRVEISG